jgi:integrase
MSKRAKNGLGTVRTVRSRSGEVVGYQALLPRHLSRAPAGHPKPDAFRQQIGDTLPTKQEAREMLDAALLELRASPLALGGAGDALELYIDLELDAREREALAVYPTAARAHRATSTWRSVKRHWLSAAPFYGWPVADITKADVQDWVAHIAVATTKRGKPVSGHFVRNVVSFLRAALAHAKLAVNPAAELDLPRRARPRVPYLNLAAQRRLLGSPDIDLRDRVMIGCGMGPGLRVNELLAMEADDVRLDGPDPHLEVNHGGPDRSPTKGRQRRIVELFEPALGFWQLWMRDFYRPGSRLVFEGPRGGYPKHWPELFPGWSPVAGQDRLTSHIMRHTYAVAMLSGTWGYEPRSLEFVCKQLGHSSIQVTERYYGAFEQGFSRETVRRMTGRGDSWPRIVVTAEELLGLNCAAIGRAVLASGGNYNRYSVSGELPRHSPQRRVAAEKQPEPDSGICGSDQASETARACIALLELIANGALEADARTIDSLRDTAELCQALAARQRKAVAGAG